ncbi:LysR family transcriptional regulator [Oceaniradius stylonematis]|uniref:LysR family transcriptional regulator n=1 Tax=Oceaniradius stylonematis TaxID=2184161 RepID=A0A3A8A6A6_9HYPH|nr:LysR family transcriptional regulator [Oceaniradius stylonematis]RKF05812.1 LysR family transcriptional regulator [Oceaniradius stylonematis]RNC95506.1 MAG: LysR family transcriptional regulator [Oricola sp.]
MDRLNYHHLRYFREVAHEGNLSRAAERLNVAQSALSSQIRTLEARLGHALFERIGRTLVLTEVGRITLDHADRIFGVGEELLATLDRSGSAEPPLRVGALSTLSRNFQIAFLRPAMAQGGVDIVLRSGSLPVLLDGLKTLSLDVVLTTQAPVGEDDAGFAVQRLDEQPVRVHGAPARVDRHATLTDLLANEPLIVPTGGDIRQQLEGLFARHGVTPRIAALVDDMAMVRLLAREDAGLAVAPSVVLADEIRTGRVKTAPFALDIVEPFYAVTAPRKYPHPALPRLLARSDAGVPY